MAVVIWLELGPNKLMFRVPVDFMIECRYGSGDMTGIRSK